MTNVLVWVKNDWDPGCSLLAVGWGTCLFSKRPTDFTKFSWILLWLYNHELLLGHLVRIKCLFAIMYCKRPVCHRSVSSGQWFSKDWSSDRRALFGNLWKGRCLALPSLEKFWTHPPPTLQVSLIFQVMLMPWNIPEKLFPIFCDSLHCACRVFAKWVSF